MPTFEATQRGYGNLFAKMKLTGSQYNSGSKIAYEIAKDRTAYEKVQTLTGVPWWWIGVVHHLESGRRFDTHLHNGDPLTGRTIRVPAGRPEKGSPPFSWQESAVDALQLKGLHEIYDWSLPRALYEWERYNGFGYYRAKINSPYLWSFSNLYDEGKYVRDGVFDRDAVSKQVGAAVILRALIDEKLVLIDEPVAMDKEEAMDAFKQEVEPLRFLAPTLVNVALGEAVSIAIKALAESFGPEKVEPTAENVTQKLRDATFTQVRDVAGKAEAKIKELMPVEPMPDPLPDAGLQDPPLPEKKPKSKIDNVTGGEMFSGLKTVIGVVSWVIVTIAGILGYIDPDTLNALQTATGGLIAVGLLAKLERAASWVGPVIRRLWGV